MDPYSRWMLRFHVNKQTGQLKKEGTFFLTKVCKLKAFMEK